MTRKFNRVAVAMGGPSAEYDISMKSGNAVYAALQEGGYTVNKVVLEDDQLSVDDDVEAVFLALHGAFGEDGTAQRQLEQMGVPYTGSGPQASLTAFDKKLSKICFAEHGIPTPRYEIITRAEDLTLGFPCVIKPPCQGSSIGVHVLMDDAHWLAAFAEALPYDGNVMVEEYIDGRELTVGIVDSEVMPVVEIIAPEGNFDFNAKYTKGVTAYVVPAEIDENLRKACQRIALETYHALECEGISRVDFRVSNAGGVFVLENNTIPGFTETSLLPKAARAVGTNFVQLCDRIMQTAACGKA